MKYIIVLFQIIIFSSYAQTESAKLNSFLSLDQVKPATVAFQIYNITKNKTVVNYNELKTMMPASLMKLITTSKAIEILGENFQYETVVNFKGNIVENKFTGFIEILANGDPTINEELINTIYNKLKEKNISNFEGYITVIERNYDNSYNKEWEIEDVANYYGTPAFCFNYKRNMFKLTLKQNTVGKKPTIIKTSPKINHLSYENLIESKNISKDKSYFIGLPFSNKRQLIGALPAGNGTFTIKGANNNPILTFKNELLEKLNEKQIIFKFKSDLLNTNNILFSIRYKSKKLSEIIKLTNYRSINLYAEALLKTLGQYKFGKASTENGLKVILENYKEDQVKLYDGSGVSRRNLVNSNLIINLLINERDQKSFYNSLSTSGISGTMKYFNSDKIKGKIRAKSGSADSVLNYAGYFIDKTGEEFAFVLMVNNYLGERNAIRKLMVNLMEQYL